MVEETEAYKDLNNSPNNVQSKIEMQVAWILQT